MKRRDFLTDFLVGGTLLNTRTFGISQQAGSPPQGASPTITEGLFVERAASDLMPSKYSPPSSLTQMMFRFLQVARSPSSSAKDTQGI